MKLRSLALSLLLTTFAGGLAFATDEPPTSMAPQASIPFVAHGGIRDWEADKTRGLWVQDAHRNWYYAKLLSPCFGLDFATRLGFDTHPMGTFDRFSSIVVPQEGRCTVQSVVPSDGPPRKHKASDSEANG